MSLMVLNMSSTVLMMLSLMVLMILSSVLMQRARVRRGTALRRHARVHLVPLRPRRPEITAGKTTAKRLSPEMKRACVCILSELRAGVCACACVHICAWTECLEVGTDVRVHVHVDRVCGAGAGGRECASSRSLQLMSSHSASPSGFRSGFTVLCFAFPLERLWLTMRVEGQGSRGSRVKGVEGLGSRV
eukprot:1401664-Rhodomonas_salina.2